MRVGVDEAGKGPVLGPMVAAAVAAPSADAVPDGVADSKTLAAERREDLAARLHADDAIGVGVAAIAVDRIDHPETDMNSLTVAAHAEALEALRDDLDGWPTPAEDDRGEPTERPTVLADAGDTSEARFARRVADAAPGVLEVAARHGADGDDPIVAAASVVAKVERDARVAAIAAEYGDVGSGYPSDPTTRAFLEAYVDEHGCLPDCARESWQTCDDLLAAAEQSALGEF